MSPELLGSLLTGLTGLLAGLAAFNASRSRRLTEDRRAARRRARMMQRRLVAALDHVDDLEQTLASRGIPIPDRPAILETDDEDDDTPPARPAPASSDAS